MGENLADNAGIKAAYNAFEAHQSFFGPDPRLPDNRFDAFTQEQLFFIGFARPWCDQTTADALITQILTDEVILNYF